METHMWPYVRRAFIDYFDSEKNASTVFDQRFYCFLIKACFQNKKIPSGYSEKFQT